MTDGVITRRQLLRAGLGGSVAVLGAAAGCIESRSPYAPPLLEDRPERVYVPSHFEGMATIGTATDGPIAAKLSYSYPHRFWLLSGRDRSRVRIQSTDSLHLMVQLWVEGTDVPLYGTSPRVTISSGDGVVAERVFWPMLSQRMGFHYGDNLALDGDDVYEIALDVPPTGLGLAGPFEGKVDVPARFVFTLDWQQSVLEELPITTVEADRQGTRDALPVMGSGPAPAGTVGGQLPGESLGSSTSDEMEITASVAPEDGEYPVVRLTAGTPHNRYAIPMLGPVFHGGGTDSRQSLRGILDPSIGLHYEADLQLAETAGDIRVSFPSPPQVARHEGYETAFMTPEPVTFTGR